MIKRILEIIKFPFYFIYLLISFPFKAYKIISANRKENKSTTSEVNFKSNCNSELLQIGELLYPKNNSEFISFFKSFLTDPKSFLNIYKEFLVNYDNFELNKLETIEVIYIFGDFNQKVWITDWRGEENDREIENFIEDKLRIKTDWNNITNLRKSSDEEKQRDGKFIIDLFITIDKDLELIKKKLIFFDLGWDAYVFTVVDQNSQKKIINKFGTFFFGVEKLRK